jgi:F-type H+-transporting ATPase subunit b
MPHIAQAAEEAASEAANPSVAGMFGLDLKLFIAQLINFGIVLFVLWKWVFKPVSKALSDRTAKIEKSLADAKQITEDKETFDTWKNAEMSKVRQEAAGIITQAKQDAESLRKQLTDQTKQEQNKIVTQTQAQLELEKQKAITEVRGQIADIVVTASEKILREKLTDKKDQELIKQALEQAQA